MLNFSVFDLYAVKLTILLGQIINQLSENENGVFTLIINLKNVMFSRGIILMKFSVFCKQNQRNLIMISE